MASAAVFDRKEGICLMDARTFVIEEELKKLPDKPGVYLMHDKDDVIIYVGKAVSLRNRVRQYFQSSRAKGPKIETMVTKIAWFEYIITDSEMEALVLECNLIKENKPKYNTMLKDDKTYPYIKVTTHEPFPRVMIVREMKKDNARYFGPYTSAGAVKDTIELIHKLYQIRTCSRKLPEQTGKGRPCLNYHIHQCQAPCQGYVTEEEYKKSVQEVLSFLGGDYDKLLKKLEADMYAAAEKMEFEEAASCRELLYSVQKVAQKQKITDSTGEDRDILGLAVDGDDAVVQIFFVREGKIIGRDHFHLSVGTGDSKEQILTGFIKQFYAGTPFIPKEIYIPVMVEDEDLICDWLKTRRGQKVSLCLPKKGEKVRLVELAQKNAELILSQNKEKMKREEVKTIGAVRELAEMLGIDSAARIEAFDISNISGFQAVGSMVVYENGKPKRSDYRKFRIRSVEGPNDYASMEEVLSRRFLHGIEEKKALREKSSSGDYSSFVRFPDLLLMDGGKGQVNVAMKVLEELKLSIPVCGMVKDDNHRTRGLYFNNRELPIDHHSELFRLITRIQDEAHRFAIEYHRSLRGKNQVHSVLDDIPGIGPARRKALMRHFKTLEDIKCADEETLSSIEGMNGAAAKSVYLFFHKEES